MTPDKEGFAYPVVQDDLCVECGLCTKVCPELQPEACLNPRGTLYAAQAKSNAVLERSSSGGIFSVVAEHILQQGGAVVGAELNDQMKVCHAVVDSQEDLIRLCGSKYVQSDTTGIYREVKDLLKAGRLVFFTGTPCQVAALNLYLGKLYDNLLTADLVCHGTPSPLMFGMLVEYLEHKYKGKMTDYHFRSKTMIGWTHTSSSSSYADKGRTFRVYYDEMMRAFQKSFLAGHVLRMDCYRCPFARPERTGDFTMADFWSLDKTNPNFPRKHRGVSMLMVNTDKGQRIIEQCASQLYRESADLDIVLSGRNVQLKQPADLTPEREGIFDFLRNNPDGFIGKYLNGDLAGDKRRFYITAIKEHIKKAIHYGGQY